MIEITDVQAGRLKHLITVLSKVTPEQFAIDSWVGNSCGTVACAAGWAGMDKQFNAEGFKNTQDIFSGFWSPEFADVCGWAAVEEFFGIENIFSEDHYPKHPSEVTPADVIQEIQKVLDQYESSKQEAKQ